MTLFFLLLSLSAFGQSDSLAEACVKRNVIDLADNLDPFFSRMANMTLFPDKGPLKIVQLGDSHIQMGHFSGGIESELRTMGYNVVNSAFWFPYAMTGGYNPVGVRFEANGPWRGEKMVGSETETRFGLTGHALIVDSSGAQTPTLKIQLPAVSDRLEILIETNAGWNFAGDSSKVKEKRISDKLTLVTIHFDKSKRNAVVHICSPKNDSRPLRILGFRGVKDDPEPQIRFESYGSSGGKYRDYVNKCTYFAEDLAHTKPDLLIISLGTNDAFGDYTQDDYLALVTGFVRSVRDILPNVSILLTSQPDTYYKEQRPASDLVVHRVLMRVAEEEKCALWELSSVMGGDGSILCWYREGLAGDDLLHFTPKGYVFQAKLLVEAMRACIPLE